MNLGTIRARVLKRSDEDTSSPVSYTVAEANAAINYGQQLFVLLTLCLENTYSLTVTPGTWYYSLLPLIPDFLAALRLVDPWAGGKIRPARLAEIDALGGWPGNNALATTRYGVLGFDWLYLYGTADSPLTLTYACSAPTLASDSDTPAIPEQYHPLLCDYAQFHLAQKPGGQYLTSALPGLERYLEGAMQLANAVRTRALGLRYDKLPLELERRDLTRILNRKDLLPARKEQPPPAA